MPRRDGTQAVADPISPSELLRRIAQGTGADVSPDDAVRALQAAAFKDLRLASESADSVIDVADTAAEPATRVRARSAVATVHCLANRFDEALERLNEADEIANASDDATQQMQVSLAFVQPLARLGRFDDAKAWAERALECARRSGDSDGEGRAECNVGVICRMQGNTREAIRRFDRSLDLLENEAARAQIVSNRAEALLEIGSFDDAERAFAAAADSFDRLGMRHASAIARGNLADLLGRQGRLQEALDAFEAARRSAGDAAPGDAARLLSEEAEVVARMGALERADGLFAQAVAELDRHGLRVEATRARVRWAESLAALGETSRAEAVLEVAVSAAEELNQPTLAARALCARARSLVQREAFIDARACAERAIELGDDAPAELAEAHTTAAEAARLIGDLDAATLHADAAAALAREHALPLIMTATLAQSAEIAARLGDRETARTALSEALRVVEHQRGAFAVGGDRMTWLAQHIGLYRELLRLTLEIEGDTEAGVARALHIAEAARSRELLESLGGVGEGSRDEDHTARRIVHERAIVELLRRRGDKADRDAADKAERELDAAAAGFDRSLRYRELLGSAPTLGEVRRVLRDTDAFVSYVPVGDRLGALVLRRDSASFVSLDTSIDDLWHLAESLLFEAELSVRRVVRSGTFADPAGEESLRGGFRRLYQATIEPIEGQLNGATRLLISPHGPLNAVTFNAAFDGAQYLVERREIAFVPSASLLVTPGPRPDESDTGLTSIGFSDAAAPRAEHEADRVADAWSAKASTGREATSAAFANAFARSRVVHVASHARFPAGQPLDAGMLLADGWLTARRVYEMRSRGALVVLGSCGAGRSVVEVGDEFLGLSRAFLTAGASGVVAPMWSAGDAFSERFMQQFHASLRTGGNDIGRFVAEPAAALAQAQRASILQKHSPALWASFTMIGRER